MKQVLITCTLLLAAIPACCQRAEVLKAFNKYHIDATAIDSLTRHNEYQFNFDLSTSIVTESNEKIYKGRHDATRTGDSAWTLLTVNGGNPSGLDRATFRKQHSDKVPPLMPDYNTFKIVKDDGKELVVSFRYDPASMISDNQFMKDNLVNLFFDARSGKLLRSEGSISHSFKIKMFKANYLTSTVTYEYNEVIKRYLPLNEEVSVNLNLLGRNVDMITTNVFSNYQADH